MRHDEFKKVYAFGVDLVDCLATSPPFDLRWVNVEHFGEMLRPEVTDKRSYLLLRGDSHDSNLALVVAADDRISARLPALLRGQRRCLVENLARDGNGIARVRF